MVIETVFSPFSYILLPPVQLRGSLANFGRLIYHAWASGIKRGVDSRKNIFYAAPALQWTVHTYVLKLHRQRVLLFPWINVVTTPVQSRGSLGNFGWLIYHTWASGIKWGIDSQKNISKAAPGLQWTIGYHVSKLHHQRVLSFTTNERCL